ncbi:MAG: hypothetical protein PUE84_04370 [Firmicutes bacterium]|nr:hypothetical protein [Bacillota bacterium]
MIKLPKEVNKVLKTLEGAGAEVYVAGECVRDSLLGGNPYGWDVVTSAGPDKLRELFPEGRVISEKYGILRLEYIEELYDKGGEFSGEEGVIIDVAPYRNNGTIETELARKAFTIDAIADSPSRLSDPYEGREDIRKKLVRTIGDPDALFREQPLKMMQAIRYAAQFGFDLHKPVYDAICSNYRKLESADMKGLRDEFTLTVSGPYGGKGLSMIMDTGIIGVILGEDVLKHLTRREKSDLTVLCQNIDKSQQVEDRRLGLFYTCMDKKRAMPSIEKLGFEGDTYQHLVDAVHDMAKLYFTAQKPELKKFIYKRGWDRYNYLANLEKAQRIVFDYSSETKIKSKMYMLEEIRMYKEPIFENELAIDGNDLMEAGICKSPEDAAKMLSMLVEEMHVHPKKNTRRDLLELAKKYKRFKFLTWTRGIHWLH